MPVTESFKKLVGPLAEYLDREKRITEISINGYGGYFIHVGHTKQYIDNERINLEWAKSFIAAVESHVGKEISRDKPTMSAVLYGGERIEIVIPPVVEEPVISIRIPSDRVFTLDDFLYENNDTKRHLIKLAQSRKTLLISGGTGSGKTSFMSALSAYLPEGDRIVTIEDPRELNLPLDRHPDQVRMVFNRDKPNQTAQALFMSCMRHNPDMVSLAECRGAEALDFLSAANSGHYGMTTVHADSPRKAIDKMATLAGQGETAMTHENLIDYLKAIIDAVVQITFDRTTGNRVVSDVLILGENNAA